MDNMLTLLTALAAARNAAGAEAPCRPSFVSFVPFGFEGVPLGADHSIGGHAWLEQVIRVGQADADGKDHVHPVLFCLYVLGGELGFG